MKNLIHLADFTSEEIYEIFHIADELQQGLHRDNLKGKTADLIIVRHKDINVIEEIAKYSAVPVINAMTDVNHPCEIISDMYALSKIRRDFTKDRFLFCGKKGNIGLAWKEAAAVWGFELEQCCGVGYEIEGVKIHHNILDAVKGKDIVSAEAISSDYFVGYEFKKCLLEVQQAIMIYCSR